MKYEMGRKETDEDHVETLYQRCLALERELAKEKAAHARCKQRAASKKRPKGENLPSAVFGTGYGTIRWIVASLIWLPFANPATGRQIGIFISLRRRRPAAPPNKRNLKNQDKWSCFMNDPLFERDQNDGEAQPLTTLQQAAITQVYSDFERRKFDLAREHQEEISDLFRDRDREILSITRGGIPFDNEATQPLPLIKEKNPLRSYLVGLLAGELLALVAIRLVPSVWPLWIVLFFGWSLLFIWE